ncbi:MAG: hypothetical protein ACRC57_10195 [Sarcina sp.]
MYYMLQTVLQITLGIWIFSFLAGIMYRSTLDFFTVVISKPNTNNSQQNACYKSLYPTSLLLRKCYKVNSKLVDFALLK